MNPWRPTKTEWITFFALMPVIDLLLNMLIFDSGVWKEGRIWLYSFPIIYVAGFVSWYLHITVMHWYRIWYPRLSQWLFRIILLFFSHVALTSLTFVGIFYGYAAVHFLGYHFNAADLRMSILIAVSLTLIASTLWEAEYILMNWKESISEKEKLQQLAIQHEFETLKGQVNPHFLFNCFNTLSSLISENPGQAETFLNELSKVYRYLLRNNEDGLSTLQQELRFIQSYYELLKTRHGEAIQLQIEIDKRYDHYVLPSLSLQLLVENAVKHNQVSKQHPLVIDIFTMAGNKLAVNNNLQPRHVKMASSKIGLENIRSKYQLLHEPGFRILRDNLNFTVILPLIWNGAGEKKFISKASVDESNIDRTIKPEP